MNNQQIHMSHSKQVKEHEVGNTLLRCIFRWIKRGLQPTDDCAALVLFTCQWVGVNIKSSCKHNVEFSLLMIVEMNTAGVIEFSSHMRGCAQTQYSRARNICERQRTVVRKEAAV